MPFLTVGKENGTNIEIYYKDWGSGQPMVFSHGWPLSADDWDTQMLFFLKKGFRVIAHDRRGHGRSSQTDGGHDMDHYADDLAALTAQLENVGPQWLKEFPSGYRPETTSIRFDWISLVAEKWKTFLRYAYYSAKVSRPNKVKSQ